MQAAQAFRASSSAPHPALALLLLGTWVWGFRVCSGASLAMGLGGPALTCGLFGASFRVHLWPRCLLAPFLPRVRGHRAAQGPANIVSGADVGLAHGLRDPEPAAAVGQAHGRLQAYLVAHGHVQGLDAAVVALQGHAQDGPGAARQRKCVSSGTQEAYLVLVQGVVLQPVHLQQLLSHPDAGQVCEDAQVAGHPEAWGMRLGSSS